MANESRSVEIAVLTRDLQYRSKLDQSAVKDYAEVLNNKKGGKQLPPIEVYRVENDADDEELEGGFQYHVTAGYHRIAAAESIGRKKIDAVIIDGTYEDACRAAARSNIEHNAVRLTNQDKRAAVYKVLDQIADKVLPKMNDPQIAEMIGASKQFVGNVKRERNGTKKPPKSETGEARKPRSNGKPKESTLVETSPKGKSEAELQEGVKQIDAEQVETLADAGVVVEESTADGGPVDADISDEALGVRRLGGTTLDLQVRNNQLGSLLDGLIYQFDSLNYALRMSDENECGLREEFQRLADLVDENIRPHLNTEAVTD